DIADGAVAREPGDAYRRYWAATYRWQALSTRRDPQTRRVLRDEQNLAEAERVIDQLNDARRLCPTYAPVYSLLGQVEYNFLGRAIGMTHVHTATRLDPNDPT